MVHASNPSTQEAKVGRLGFRGQDPFSELGDREMRKIEWFIRFYFCCCYNKIPGKSNLRTFYFNHIMRVQLSTLGKSFQQGLEVVGSILSAEWKQKEMDSDIQLSQPGIPAPCPCNPGSAIELPTHIKGESPHLS